MQRIIFHLDMDAFYAAVEQRDHPEFRGKPVIVGSPPNQRGVVCAASYEARKFGVRSAMPSATAGKLCPRGIFVTPRMSDYREESRAIMQLLGRPGAIIEQVSIDEAYLDISNCEFPVQGNVSNQLEYSGAVALAKEMRRTIFEKRKLTASIGVASNKFLAKLASDFQKPNGLTLIPERDKVLFLRPLPVRAIHGVGRVTEQVLRTAGIETIGQLQDFSGDLRRLVGSFGPTLKQFAFGEDDRAVEIDDEVKSIGSEETFDRDTDNKRQLAATLKQQSAEISKEMKAKVLGAQTVQIKVRYSDFTTLTRQITVEEVITEPEELYRLACFLLAREKLVNRPLRLLGLSVSGLKDPENRQLQFWARNEQLQT